MSKSKKVEPALVEVTVAYSAGVKAAIAKFENADLHTSETERWNVEGMTDEQAQEFVEGRYDLLKERIDQRIATFYSENSENCR